METEISFDECQKAFDFLMQDDELKKLFLYVFQNKKEE